MERSSFFNSVNHDRRYRAEDWAAYFASLIGNGVFPSPSTGLQVVAADGMNVTLRAGRAWINGYFYWNTSDLTIPIAVADGVLKRIDRIVIRWDLTERKITAEVKSSSPSSNPTPPELQRDADRYEIASADLLISNGIISISQAAITDRRFDTSLCGIVTGLIKQIDFATLTAQFDSFYTDFVASAQAYADQQKQTFITWFESIRGILSEDAAGNLQLEIENLYSKLQSHTHSGKDGDGDRIPFSNLDNVMPISGILPSGSGIMMPRGNIPSNGADANAYNSLVGSWFVGSNAQSTFLNWAFPGTPGILEVLSAGGPTSYIFQRATVYRGGGGLNPPSVLIRSQGNNGVWSPWSQQASVQSGTWNPSVSAAGYNVTVNNSAGQYILLGNLVHIECQLSLTLTGSQASSAVTISGVPYPFPRNVILPMRATGLGVNGTNGTAIGFGNASTSIINIQGITDAGSYANLIAQAGTVFIHMAADYLIG